MHRKLLRAAATVAVLGGTVTLGLGSTQTALASPTPPTFVPCDASLSAAISDADSGAVLALAPGCTYWLTEAGLPMINKTLTIVGHDSSITRSYADDTPSFTIFSVCSGGDLTLDNVNVRNGDSNDNGGALSNVNGIVTINGGTFSDNHAVDNGGAIYSDDGIGTVTINGATFKDNAASEDGGAIYNDAGATVTIHGTTFIGNHATDNGGAIYNDSTLTGTHARFGFNAADYGGGVYNDDDGTSSLTGGLIMFNRASEEDGGGGVYNNDGGSATVTGVMIMFNTPDNCAGTITGC
jgi:predicted outer membrane repeat protein